MKTSMFSALRTASILLLATLVAIVEAQDPNGNIATLTSTTTTSPVVGGPSSATTNTPPANEPTITASVPIGTPIEGTIFSSIPVFSQFPATETITTCFVSATGVYPATTSGIDADGILPVGAVCYEIYRDGGSIVEANFTTIVGAPTTLPYIPVPDPSTIGSSSSLESTSSSSHVGAIVGGVLGGVAFILLAGVILIWFRRQRKSGRPLSRAWVHRPGGWVQNEKPTTHIEMNARGSV